MTVAVVFTQIGDGCGSDRREFCLGDVQGYVFGAIKCQGLHVGAPQGGKYQVVGNFLVPIFTGFRIRRRSNLVGAYGT